MVTLKLCRTCIIKKLPANFYKNKKYIDGLRSECKDCTLAQGNAWVRNNRDKVNAKSAKWRHSNPDKFRASRKNWELNNPDMRNARTAKRRADRINRTPFWVKKSDLIEIDWAYKIARDRSSETGVKYVVDHIIPFNGKEVSGLHVPWNLQVITEKENLKKSNKV